MMFFYMFGYRTLQKQSETLSSWEIEMAVSFGSICGQVHANYIIKKLFHHLLPLQCRSLDGSLTVELFAFYPAVAVQSTLNAASPTLGLTISQIQLLQGYLYWVCRNFIVPTALYGGPTGQPLGPAAGGLLVRRSIYEWIYGLAIPSSSFHRVVIGSKTMPLYGSRFKLLGCY